MNVPCVPPCALIPLHRPWWARLIDRWREAPRRVVMPQDPDRWADADWRALQRLDRRTLRDLGAPDWVRSRSEQDAELTRALLGR